MAENDINVLLERVPKTFSARVAINYVIFCAFEEVFQKICKNVYDGFAWRERLELKAVLGIIYKGRWSQMQLKPKDTFPCKTPPT